VKLVRNWIFFER